MGRTGIFHHFGTFLLLVATVLLIVTDISAPVVHRISMLEVRLANTSDTHHSKVTFGTFGHCILDVAPGTDRSDYCSPSVLGYSPSDVMFETEGTAFSQAQASSTNTLTKVMVLHPIATGICFIAFLLSLGAGVFGSFLASVVAALAFIVTIVVLACDFVLFSVVKRQVNNDGTGSDADFGAAIWTLVASAVCSLLATVVVFFTCCSARLHKRRTAAHTSKADYVEPTTARPARRRRWF